MTQEPLENATGAAARNATDLVALAFTRMVRNGTLAFVALDANGLISAAHGADWLEAPRGARGADILPFLTGMDSTLEALAPDGPPIVLANVGLAPLSSTPVKVTAQIFREGAGHLICLARIDGQAELEFEVTRQVRARRLAEAELRTAERALVASAERLQEMNAALSRANGELEDFAHVISHDLKAPLRTMRLTLERVAAEGLLSPPSPSPPGRVLRSDGAGASDGAEADPAAIAVPWADFERLHQQTERMSGMISGLLTYAQAGSETALIENVDTAALARRILTSLQAGDLELLAEDAPGPRFEMTGTWTRLETAYEPLDVVLRNLVSNAVKHHDRPSPRILLAAATADEHVTFTVTDDGPGIPSDVQQAVFQPFQTAEGSKRDGSGLGLSLVQRIAERVGATVEVVSPVADGRGTAMIVRWPRVSGGAPPEAG